MVCEVRATRVIATSKAGKATRVVIAMNNMVSKPVTATNAIKAGKVTRVVRVIMADINHRAAMKIITMASIIWALMADRVVMVTSKAGKAVREVINSTRVMARIITPVDMVIREAIKVMATRVTAINKAGKVTRVMAITMEQRV